MLLYVDPSIFNRNPKRVRAGKLTKPASPDSMEKDFAYTGERMSRQLIEKLKLGNGTWTQVRFDPAAIVQLTEQAMAGVRVHELMSVTQLGHVCRYLRVLIDPRALMPDVDQSQRVPHPESKENEPIIYGQFLDLTRSFDVASAWQSIVYGMAFRKFVMELMGMVEATQCALRTTNDPLIRHELDLIGRHAHPRELAQTEGGMSLHDSARDLDITPVYGQGFYTCLTDLAALPAICSLSYCGMADYQTLRIACMERLRRGGLPSGDENIFEIHVLDMKNRWGTETTHEPDEGYRYALSCTPAWFEGIRFYIEGVGHGDLFIDDAVFRSNLDEVIEKHWGGDILLTTQLTGPHHPAMEWYRHSEGFCVGLKKTAATDEMRAVCSRHRLLPVSQASP